MAKETEEKPKYDVAMLAEELDRSPAEVRTLLRRSDIEKPGPTWGWNKKSEYDAALKALKALTAKPAKAAPTKGDKPAKAARKTKEKVEA